MRSLIMLAGKEATTEENKQQQQNSTIHPPAPDPKGVNSPEEARGAGDWRKVEKDCYFNVCFTLGVLWLIFVICVFVYAPAEKLDISLGRYNGKWINGQFVMNNNIEPPTEIEPVSFTNYAEDELSPDQTKPSAGNAVDADHKKPEVEVADDKQGSYKEVNKPRRPIKLSEFVYARSAGLTEDGKNEKHSEGKMSGGNNYRQNKIIDTPKTWGVKSR